MDDDLAPLLNNAVIPDDCSHEEEHAVTLLPECNGAGALINVALKSNALNSLKVSGYY